MFLRRASYVRQGSFKVPSVISQTSFSKKIVQKRVCKQKKREESNWSQYRSFKMMHKLRPKHAPNNIQKRARQLQQRYSARTLITADVLLRTPNSLHACY